MSDSNVLALPAPAVKASELEARLLGGLLERPGGENPLDMLQASALSPNDLTDVRVRTAIGIARRLAEHNQKVTALTVFSAGASAKVFGDAELVWLEGLSAANSLDRAAWLQVCEDVRRASRGRQSLNRMAELSNSIRAGHWSPATLARAFEALAAGLDRDFSPDDTASTSLLEGLAAWDARDKEPDKFRPVYLPTGIEVLDREIRGFPPNLTIVLGQEGIGKTTFLGTVIDGMLAASPSLRLGLVGLEDGDEWLYRRLLARDLDLELRDIGSIQRSPELAEKTHVAAERIHAQLSRVTSYRMSRIRRADLLRRMNRWVFEQGVGAILIDHMGEIDHGAGDFWQGVEETIRDLRDFARRHAVPVILVVHAADEQGGKPAPPLKMQGGRSVGRKARLVLGLWRKNQSLRCTVLKANEGPPDATIEFDRIFKAALLNPLGGTMINLEREAAKERREKKEQNLDESIDLGVLRKEKQAKRKVESGTEEPKKVEPQQSLFDTPKENGT